MKRQGPILTLLAGVMLAAVVGVLSVRANSPEQTATGRTPPPVATATPRPTISPQLTQGAANVPPRANYAGRTEGRKATIAIAIRDGGAIAYVCDGRRTEAWLLGSASDGRLALSGEGDARLTAAYGDGKATGTVWLGSKKWAFSVPAVRAPNGLYRADATVGGVRFRGGWIVLPDGQMGVTTSAGQPAPAPRLDPAGGAVTIDGTRVPVEPVSGVDGGGF